MSNKPKETPFHINIGSSSILIIFVTLCLVAFATLSIVSANADAKLSNKVAERTQKYYEAHNQATACIKELDEELAAAYTTATDTEEYFSLVGHDRAYTFSLSDMQDLSVTVNILYPTKATDSFYEITSWKVITTGEIEYDNNMIVIP